MSLTAEKRYFLGQPHGFSALFFTQLFGTMSFAVLYATLVLYMKDQLHFSASEANLITGVYFACNFSLHLLSGYLGGRYFSYRGLVVLGVIFQLVGCLILSLSHIQTLYWGLACMLMGTGTMVTCLNMLISQLYTKNDIGKRQSGFLWNYSSMNIGFMLGFTMTGYFQLHVDYAMLFLITAFNNIIALVVLFSQWKFMKDKDTLFSLASDGEKKSRLLKGLLIVFCLVPALTWLLRHTVFSDRLILALGVLVALFLAMIAFRSEKRDRRKMVAFLVLLLSAQIFWIVYQLSPMALTLFAKNNVDRHVLGFVIAPGWIQNINSITIIVGAPLLGLLFAAIAKRRQKMVLLPLQYVLGLFVSAIGLLILPIGMALGHAGYTAFIWLFFTFFLQAVAELLISPVGYSMVGQLVPQRWQGICMGAILLNSGVAAVLASYFSNDGLGASGSVDPLVTNPSYAHMFNQLGWTAMAVAGVLLLLTPLLNRFIQK